MQEKNFEQLNVARWREFEILLTAAEKKTKGVDLSKLPTMLRLLSSDLSLARHRMYSTNMCEYLNTQVIRGYKLVQNGEMTTIAKIIQFFLVDFPCAVRKEWKLHLLCWLVCLVPAFMIINFSNENNLEWVDGVMSPYDQQSINDMYGDGSNLEEGRGEGGDFMMFTFYIWNNVGIDFQIFASGIIGGIGSLYYLFHNALHFGAVVAYVEADGDNTARNLYGFVSSHAPYELWAMIISGMAGMKIGFTLLMPGRRSHIAAFRSAGKTAIPLIIGAASMTFLAACIEGFWSANSITAGPKIWIGFAGWLLLLIYFCFCGRGRKLNEA